MRLLPIIMRVRTTEAQRRARSRHHLIRPAAGRLFRSADHAAQGYKNAHMRHEKELCERSRVVFCPLNWRGTKLQTYTAETDDRVP